MRRDFVIRRVDNCDKVPGTECRVLAKDLAAKFFDILVDGINALGILVERMSPFMFQRAQQDVGWHDALLAIVVAPWNYEPSACAPFACHGTRSRNIQSAAVGAVAAKSRRFYRVLERPNALNYSPSPAAAQAADLPLARRAARHHSL